MRETAFGQEWITLQGNHEKHEHSRLLIKLTCIVLWVAGLALWPNWMVIILMILLLWIQESIFSTFQSRLAERILRIEHFFKDASQEGQAPFQLHSEWEATRPGMARMLAQYAANALRPTVAFPYVPLIVITFLIWLA
jgi:hypothetical protein